MADNYINVTVTSKQNKKVTVSTQDPGYEVTATTDTGKFWAKTAEKWAISDTIVENKDYSSKYYANKAKASEENARVYENAVKDTYNTFIAESGNIADEVRNAGQEGLNSIEASRLDAVDSINTVKDESIATVENKANEALTLVNNGITQINTTKNTAVDSINATKTTILKDIEFVAEGEKEEIQELADKAKDDIESTGFYMRDDKLYFINSKGEEEEFKSGAGLDDKITNCLLEVPQDIKLELNNGVLTLKAGSKVYVPNGKNADGSNKFDVVVIESDKTCLGFDAGTCIAFINDNGDLYASLKISPYTCSGSSAPTDFIGLFYNTTTNTIGVRFDTSSQFSSGYSLPIAIVTNSSTTVCSSIDQVFNGFGYIGSTVFALPGVKGLIPNGRNEDGSLNNIEVNNTSLKILNQSGTYNLKVALAKTGLGAYYYEYDALNNYIYRPDTGARYYDRFIIGDLSTVDGKITSFQTKQPVKLVRHDELQECQVVVETYVNGTSWYRIWSDGWIEQGGRTSSSAGSTARTVSLLKTFSNTNYCVNLTSFTGGSSQIQYNSFQCTAKTASSFTARAGCSEAIILDWCACGY